MRSAVDGNMSFELECAGEQRHFEERRFGEEADILVENAAHDDGIERACVIGDVDARFTDVERVGVLNRPFNAEGMDETRCPVGATGMGFVKSQGLRFREISVRMTTEGQNIRDDGWHRQKKELASDGESETFVTTHSAGEAWMNYRDFSIT